MPGPATPLESSKFYHLRRIPAMHRRRWRGIARASMPADPQRWHPSIRTRSPFVGVSHVESNVPGADARTTEDRADGCGFPVGNGTCPPGRGRSTVSPTEPDRKLRKALISTARGGSSHSWPRARRRRQRRPGSPPSGCRCVDHFVQTVPSCRLVTRSSPMVRACACSHRVRKGAETRVNRGHRHAAVGLPWIDPRLPDAGELGARKASWRPGSRRGGRGAGAGTRARRLEGGKSSWRTRLRRRFGPGWSCPPATGCRVSRSHAERESLGGSTAAGVESHRRGLRGDPGEGTGPAPAQQLNQHPLGHVVSWWPVATASAPRAWLESSSKPVTVAARSLHDLPASRCP